MLPPDRMIVALVVGGIAVSLFWLFLVRASKFRPLRGVATTAAGQLIPEGLYNIAVTDEALAYENPDGTTETIGWDQLNRVEVVTTDEGPFLPDSFWVLTGNQTQCTIAQGAQNENLLLERLQTLPGFDNDGLISAMGSTANARFLCWDKYKRG